MNQRSIVKMSEIISASARHWNAKLGCPYADGKMCQVALRSAALLDGCSHSLHPGLHVILTLSSQIRNVSRRYVVKEEEFGRWIFPRRPWMKCWVSGPKRHAAMLQFGNWMQSKISKEARQHIKNSFVWYWEEAMQHRYSCYSKERGTPPALENTVKTMLWSNPHKIGNIYHERL